MTILGNRIDPIKKYVEKLADDPELLEEIEARIAGAIFYAADDVAITMSTTQWDAVLVLLREGKRSYGFDD